jgi:CheY-like chemotaxis protein
MARRVAAPEGRRVCKIGSGVAHRIGSRPGSADSARRSPPVDATPVVLLSAREEAELQERGATAGATGYLAKPFQYGDLLECVARLGRPTSA